MTENRWCPKWIRRNYEIQNKSREDVHTAPASVTLLNTKGEAGELPEANAPELAKDTAFPHGDKFKTTFTFEPSGEPPVAEDTERPEEYTAEHHWDKNNRPSWQQHSEVGPNVDPEGKGDARPLLSFEEIVNPLQPPLGKEYDRHWYRKNYDRETVHA